MGREPTSFGAKPQHCSYVPALRKNDVIPRLNDTACDTQKMLCLMVQIKNPKAKTFGFLCLQVNLDAEFVLSNLDAARWYTSPLVKQRLASDRDLPGLRSHACKRAYVYYVRIQVS